MRKHLQLITDDEEDEGVIGNVVATDSQRPNVEKNVERRQDLRNLETDEEWHRWAVGLGYVDFESEEQFRDTDHYVEVVKRKLREVDDRHLEKAGVDLDGVPA